MSEPTATQAAAGQTAPGADCPECGRYVRVGKTGGLWPHAPGRDSAIRRDIADPRNCPGTGWRPTTEDTHA